MLRFIILLAFCAVLLNFANSPEGKFIHTGITKTEQDTVPIRIDEALIQELINDPKNKTWEDSGWYLQFETVDWIAKRLGNTVKGDMLMLASFSSADPGSLQFKGQAVFRFDPSSWPDNITPSKGMRGEAVIAFPQDVLFCPSPTQEIGLGQHEIYYPLYLGGEITGVNSIPGKIETPMSVQLRDMEIIL